MLRLATVVLALLASAPRAEVKLHGLFTDNAVLQQDIAAPIWGTAEPGEAVTVAIAGQKKTATADKDGAWSVKLGPLKAGGPHELTVAGKNTIALKNVLVGEVWICSGQSNMQWSVQQSANPQAEIAAAAHPKIRLFTVTRGGAEAPQRAVKGGPWQECSPQSVPGFSAVAYYFGRDLQKVLDVPIGLISTNVGGTAAERWTNKKTMEGDAELKSLAAGYPQALANYEKAAEQHKAAAEKAKADGKPAPPAPRRPSPPGDLYNNMIAPLPPFAIRGAIWYQGESNAGRARQYGRLFPAMIQNWRSDWGQGDFPFLFVQLCNFTSSGSWPELREAQLDTLSLPKTGMAVTIDIGDPRDIHPKNKQDVGKRLSLAAQSVAYGKDICFSGPLYKSMVVEGNKARLSFTHIGGGLAARDGKLAGFTIAGEDKAFVPAEAKIDGPTLVVWSDKVARPVAVRYAWADNPECGLVNKEGLPASPFRTDRANPQ